MVYTSSTDRARPAWWYMFCDQNHSWWRLLPSGSEPFGEDLRCPTDGTEAVTAGRHELADRVSVKLVPATWEREGKVGFRDEYFIEIGDRNEVRVLRSGRVFDLDEACRRLVWFKDVTWEQAERRWNRAGLHKIDPLKRASDP